MSEWKKVKIGDVCTTTKGATGIQKAVAGEYSMVTLAEERTTHNEFQFDCDAVIVPLVSSTGHGHASMKRVHYQEGKFALGSILCAVVPNDLNFLNPKYLHIYLSYLKEKLLVPLMRGAANVSLSISNIKTVEIIVPPIEKQIEIIELEKKVRTQRQKLDEKNSNQNNYLTSLRQQILQDAISGKLTIDWRAKNPDIEPASKLLEKIKAEKEKLIAEKKIKKEKPLPKIAENEIPFDLLEKWEWCRLGDVGFTQTGTTPPTLDKGNFGNDIPFIKPADIKVSWQIDYENEKLSNKGLELGRLIRSGSAMMVCIGGSIGKSGICSMDVSCNQQINTITPLANMSSWYIQYLLQSPYFQKTVWGRASGGTTPIVNKTKWETIPFPLPPLAEQKAIVAKIEKLMEHISKLEEKIKHNKQDAEMLMQSFLVESFKN